MRKLYILIFISIVTLVTTAYSLSQPNGKTLSASEVKNKWGNAKFNATKFKSGNAKAKAEMAYSLMSEESKWVGKDVDEVRRTLGNPDGFYFIDIHPAYIVQEGLSNKEETWQLVFLLDNSFKVKKIFMHKNCCYN